jgi:hypothetical protein
LAHEESYPVTAAQLLPIHTGFLATIHGSNSQRTAARSSGLRFFAQDLFVRRLKTAPRGLKNLNFLVTGGAGFIGSNLVLSLQEKYPAARLTVIDDFRSGDFKNLEGYRGILSRPISPRLIGAPNLARRSSTAFSISRRSLTPPCTINSRRYTTTWRAFADCSDLPSRTGPA